jgi:hypothetical protein
MTELLSYWSRFRSNSDDYRFERGRAKWRHLFLQLKTIRRWSTEDRIRETGIHKDWQERLLKGQETVTLEIELVFKGNSARRQESTARVRQLVTEEGGDVIGESVIEAISYHALMVRLPIGAVEAIVNRKDTRLALCGQVLFFRPVGQAMVPGFDIEPADVHHEERLAALPHGEPVAALLDGLPLQNHQWLAGRLRIDDPDGWEANYPADQRIHGTTMASLIIHGDASGPGEPISRPLYVRPILQPVSHLGSKEEGIPENVLPVDLVHRAVRRLFEAEEGGEAVAPRICLINLSVCDRARSFDRFPSPWARLLDYVSWRYRVLFIVSAGNYPTDIELSIPRTQLSDLLQDRNSLENEILNSVSLQTRHRRLRSPAEAINALTIGAIHEDVAVIPAASLERNRVIDVFASSGLPSPYNAQGPGFRRSVKPELQFPGGRLGYREKLGTAHTQATLQPVFGGEGLLQQPPGQRVAVPGIEPGRLNAFCYTCGTSNAAGLATRASIQLYEMLEELRQAPGGDQIGLGSSAVLLKALLVHSSSWGDTGQVLIDRLGECGRIATARLIGYGLADPDRVLACDDERVTILGCGNLTSDETCYYSFPLPPCLSGKTARRRLTVTLAWLSPINPNHQGCRRADLWFEIKGSKADGESRVQTTLLQLGSPAETESDGDVDSSYTELLNVKRTDVDWQMARRGTVQHEVWSGDRATAYLDGGALRIYVTCRADAGELGDDVPFALAATLEVAPGLGLPLYDEVAARIRPLVRVG